MSCVRAAVSAYGRGAPGSLVRCSKKHSLSPETGSMPPTQRAPLGPIVNALLQVMKASLGILSICIDLPGKVSAGGIGMSLEGRGVTLCLVPRQHSRPNYCSTGVFTAWAGGWTARGPFGPSAAGL